MSEPTVSVAKHESKSSLSLNVEEAAAAIFDRALGQPGSGRGHLLSAFEDALGELTGGPAGQDGVRDISKAAALATARSHGNIIETGRILLGSIDDLGGRLGLDLRRCKENTLLGLAEGACQVGPIVYGRFLDIANEYRDNADEWILKNKRRPASFDVTSLPVIVPFESELTLKTGSFQVEPGVIFERPRAALEAPVPEVSVESAVEAPVEWSRPKGKGFFRRLSDVMGGLFGRR